MPLFTIEVTIATMSSVVSGRGALSLDVASVGPAMVGVELVTPFSAGLSMVVPGFGVVLGVELHLERELKIVATIVGISADERFSTTAGSSELVLGRFSGLCCSVSVLSLDFLAGIVFFFGAVFFFDDMVAFLIDS